MHFWDQHKVITYYYESLSKSICEKYNLTKMEYDILMFLYNNPQFNTAADIVKVGKSTKSHVSLALKSLREKGLIEKKQSPKNKKIVEIFMLDEAKKIVEDGIDLQKRLMHNLLDGFTEDEKKMWKSMFDKICANSELYLKKQEQTRCNNVSCK